MGNKKNKVCDGSNVKKKSRFVEVFRRLSDNKGAMVGLVILILVLIVTIFGNKLAPYQYDKADPYSRSIPPCWAHPFGTDDMGRDILSRMLVGAKYSLGIGVGAVLVSTTLGVFFGSLAGFFGGAVDQVVMRVCDVIQSVPGMILNIAMAMVLGPGVINTMLALGIGGVAGSARMMRASILRVRKMEYLDAATAINCRGARIIIKHVIPNAFSPMIVQMTMGVGGRIISAASLSYLGMGVQPPAPEWGAMLTAGRSSIKGSPYMTIIPGLCIMLVVLSMNLLGDGLRDALDPKLKK